MSKQSPGDRIPNLAPWWITCHWWRWDSGVPRIFALEKGSGGFNLMVNMHMLYIINIHVVYTYCQARVPNPKPKSNQTDKYTKSDYIIIFHLQYYIFCPRIYCFTPIETIYKSYDLIISTASQVLFNLQWVVLAFSNNLPALESW